MTRPGGFKFKVQQNMETQENRPKPGEIVTIEHYTTLRRDAPVNPKILRIRKDLSWDNVLQDYIRNKKGNCCSKQSHNSKYYHILPFFLLTLVIHRKF
jgi:hypothetical protein